MRRALRHDATLVEHNHALAEGKNFLAAVGDIKDGNAVSLIPGAEIVDDLALGRGIERRQRFVQQQQFGISHQRSR